MDNRQQPQMLMDEKGERIYVSLNLDHYLLNHQENFRLYRRRSRGNYETFLTKEIEKYVKCLDNIKIYYYNGERYYCDKVLPHKVIPHLLDIAKTNELWRQDLEHSFEQIIQFIESEDPEIKKINQKGEAHAMNHDPILITVKSAGQKVMYLKELGVLDFLIDKHRLNIDGSINCGGLASFIQGITGEQQGTLGDILRCIYHNPTSKNNPYNTAKNKDYISKKVEELLTKYPPL